MLFLLLPDPQRTRRREINKSIGTLSNTHFSDITAAFAKDQTSVTERDVFPFDEVSLCLCERDVQRDGAVAFVNNVCVDFI